VAVEQHLFAQVSGRFVVHRSPRHQRIMPLVKS
jgi:hypothetical protein